MWDQAKYQARLEELEALLPSLPRRSDDPDILDAVEARAEIRFIEKQLRRYRDPLKRNARHHFAL